MRRTRHVVLPVRSWQYTGLLVVSLACLTLGLVSRDRGGQAGNLAGPDLQHGAPHKVDTCLNEIALNWLLSYDDLALDFGPILTDQTKSYTAGSENVLSVNKREARRNVRVWDISYIRDDSSAATLLRSIARNSGSSDCQKNLKLVRNHRICLNRNSEAIDDHRKENCDEKYQRSRSTGSMNHNYGLRHFHVKNQRRFSRISDQRSQTHRTITERSNFERQKNRQHREVRNTDVRETVTELLVEAHAKRSRTRHIRNDQSDRRDSRTRNVRVTVNLSATRNMISPDSETDSSAEVSSLTTERRIRRFTRSVRVHQSRVQDSAVEHSSENFRSSEREGKSQLRNRQIGLIRSNVRLLTSVAELRNAGLNRQVQKSRATVGDLSTRDSRLAVDVRNGRLNRRTGLFFDLDSVNDKQRLTAKRTRMLLNRSTENSRFSESDPEQEESQLTSQRRGDRKTRDIRENRSFQTSSTTRYSRVLPERENVDRRTDRSSRSRSDFRNQGLIDYYSFEHRNVRFSDRGIDQQRVIRDSGNGESCLPEERRNTGEATGTQSSDFEARSRNSRSLVTRTTERMARDIRAIERDSRIRDSRIRDSRWSPVLHYRDARYFVRGFLQAARYSMHAAVIRRLDTSLLRHRFSSINHREQRFEKHNRADARHQIMNERGSTRILYGGNLMHRVELLTYRQDRVRAKKNNETIRRNFEGNRKIREALGLVISSKGFKNLQGTEVIWTDVTNSLTERIGSPTKYDILKQLGIQLLCVVYCASLYSGKEGYSSTFFNQGNRFAIW